MIFNWEKCKHAHQCVTSVIPVCKGIQHTYTYMDECMCGFNVFLSQESEILNLGFVVCVFF